MRLARRALFSGIWAGCATLGTLAGDAASEALALNDASDVVGRSGAQESLTDARRAVARRRHADGI
jgi:hypothetical protein